MSVTEPATFLWEKSITAALVNAGKLRRVEEFDAGWPAFVVVASDAFLAEHSTKIDVLLRVFRDQARGLMQKKTAPEMVAHRYGMSAEDALEWFRTVRWNMDGKVDLGALEKVAQVLAGTGMLEHPIDRQKLEALVWSAPLGKKA